MNKYLMMASLMFSLNANNTEQNKKSSNTVKTENSANDEKIKKINDLDEKIKKVKEEIDDSSLDQNKVKGLIEQYEKLSDEKTNILNEMMKEINDPNKIEYKNLQINVLEAKIDKLTTQLKSPNIYNDGKKTKELTNQISNLSNEKIEIIMETKRLEVEIERKQKEQEEEENNQSKTGLKDVKRGINKVRNDACCSIVKDHVIGMCCSVM